MFSVYFTTGFDFERRQLSPWAKIKKSDAIFVALCMMNKCAKYHGDSVSGKILQFNLTRAIELQRWPILCTTSYRDPIKGENLGGTFDQYLVWNFYVVFKGDGFFSTLIFYYPGQKKKTSSRFARRTLFHVWYHAQSGAISAGQVRSATVPRLFALRWLRLIEHDITLGTAFFSPRISRMVLFLSRVV